MALNNIHTKLKNNIIILKITYKIFKIAYKIVKIKYLSVLYDGPNYLVTGSIALMEKGNWGIATFTYLTEEKNSNMDTVQ